MGRAVEDGPLEFLEKGPSYASQMQSGIVMQLDYSTHDKTSSFRFDSFLKAH